MMCPLINATESRGFIRRFDMPREKPPTRVAFSVDFRGVSQLVNARSFSVLRLAVYAPKHRGYSSVCIVLWLPYQVDDYPCTHPDESSNSESDDELPEQYKTERIRNQTLRRQNLME
jgi:hypothetical protein